MQRRTRDQIKKIENEPEKFDDVAAEMRVAVVHELVAQQPPRLRPLVRAARPRPDRLVHEARRAAHVAPLGDLGARAPSARAADLRRA